MFLLRPRQAAWTVGLVGVIITITGCDGGGLVRSGPDTSSLSAETVLTSTTLSGAPLAAQELPAAQEATGLLITPENVTGQVLSLLFATDGQDDEGLVIFGNSRPDIAPADSVLIDFDLAEPEPILSTIQLKPGFVGGQSSLMPLLFGYFDLHFTLDEVGKVVRVALADTDDMLRGDKLLLNAATDTFEWYDLDSGSFTTEHPDNPALIEPIANFTDPIRPNLVYYPINATVLTPVDLDPGDLAAATLMTVTLDFVMTQAITLVGEFDQTTVTDPELIVAFDLSQNASDLTPGTPGFGESGFLVDATVGLVTVQIQPAP
ncbi:MAG: hypothetical protein IH988_11450 [Planctomycetes bacterium]|nr:hypothetical protein [Planctomycetota bacterium]